MGTAREHKSNNEHKLDRESKVGETISAHLQSHQYLIEDFVAQKTASLKLPYLSKRRYVKPSGHSYNSPEDKAHVATAPIDGAAVAKVRAQGLSFILVCEETPMTKEARKEYNAIVKTIDNALSWHHELSELIAILGNKQDPHKLSTFHLAFNAFKSKHGIHTGQSFVLSKTPPIVSMAKKVEGLLEMVTEALLAKAKSAIAAPKPLRS